MFPYHAREPHPGFLAYVPSCPTFPAVLGDWIATGYNFFAGVWPVAAGPNEIEIVWSLADGRSVYVKEDPGRAGGGLVTVIVDDLDAFVAEIGERGLEPTEREEYSNGVRNAIYRDDEGNEIGFGGLPGGD